jgi:acetyl esterase/lipase
VLTRPGRAPDLTLPYGPLPDQVVDVRLPAAAGERPLVVVVHGGFWRAAFDRAHATAQSDALADAGYVTATVEFRRTGMPGGGWPGTFDDTALWADQVEDLVAAGLSTRAGDVRLQRGRTVLVGHSAGGHLAAWAASRHRLPADSPWHRQAPPRLAGVVSLAGVLDLAECERLRLDDDAVRLLLGSEGPPTAERLDAADPARLLPVGQRMVLLHGTADDRVPVDISRSYAATAAAAGDTGVTLHELDGTGHFEVIDPLSSAWTAVLDAVGEVLA